MLDPSFSSVVNKDFSGAWLLPDATSVPLRNALQSQNVAYAPGNVGTRLGFSLALSTTDSISAMYNWVSFLGNLLLWYRTTDRSLRKLDISVGSGPTTVIAGDLIGYAATFAEAGARLYLSFFSSAGVGASGCRVLTYQAPNFVSDLAFRPPMTYVPPSPIQPGVGSVTAGIHNLGYRIGHRSGFVGRLCPDSGVGTTPSLTTFVPIQFTAAGNSYLSWTLLTTWPVDAISVYAVMTPVDNLADYRMIPGAVQAVTGGATSAITFTIDISDDLLTETGEDATDALQLLTNSVSDTPQFLPSAVLTHGNRMVYVTRIMNSVGGFSSALFISDLPAEFRSYQTINVTRSLIQIPGLRQITTAASVNGSLFIFGPEWTYRTADNGSDPSTWATPILVDGRRGTLSIRGVEVSPSGLFAWVAASDGLYYFQGQFTALPISYYEQPDWDRINWNVPNAVQVKDDPGIKKVYVMACLDAATTPSHKLTWDYTKGYTPEKVQYSIDSIQSYNMGSMELTKNSLPGSVVAAAQKKELWLGSSDIDGLLRRNSVSDTDPYLDNHFPIFSIYETSLYPQGRENVSGEIYQHHGAEYRLTGEGVLSITAYSLDHAESFPLLDVTLGQAPGRITSRFFDLITEGASHLITQGQNLVGDIGEPITPEVPVPIVLIEDPFIYAGVPLVLSQTPLPGTAVQLFWGPLFQKQTPANYTVAGKVVTLVNVAYVVGDEITIVYPV